MKKISAKQYAYAIYSLAHQENNVEEIIADLEQVAEKLNESPSFKKHLGYHKLTILEKNKNLHEVFSDFISQKTYKIITLLIKNKHLADLEQIITHIKSLKKEDENILDAKVIVPFNLDNDEKSKIKSILQDKTGRQIIIHEEIDKNVIGGMKIQLGDIMIDGTIAGRLEKLRQGIKSF